MIMVQHLVSANAFGNQQATAKSATTASPTRTPSPSPSPSLSPTACSPATPTAEQPHSPLTPVSPKQEEAHSPATPTSAHTTPTLVQALTCSNWVQQKKSSYEKDTNNCAINAKELAGGALTPAPTPTTSPTSTSPVPLTNTTTTTTTTTTSNTTTTTTTNLPTETQELEVKEHLVEEFAVLYSHLRQRQFQTTTATATATNTTTTTTTALVQPQMRRSVITTNSNKIDHAQQHVSSSHEGGRSEAYWHRPAEVQQQVQQQGRGTPTQTKHALKSFASEDDEELEEDDEEEVEEEEEAEEEEEEEEEYPLDLSINAAATLRRTFSGSESDDSISASNRRRNNAKHLKTKESSAAYKKSLMKRYCKLN